MSIGWIGWIGSDQFIGDGDLTELPPGEDFLAWDGETGLPMDLAWDNQNGVETLLAWSV